MGKSLPETCWADLGDQQNCYCCISLVSILPYLDLLHVSGQLGLYQKVSNNSEDKNTKCCRFILDIHFSWSFFRLIPCWECLGFKVFTFLLTLVLRSDGLLALFEKTLLLWLLTLVSYLNFRHIQIWHGDVEQFMWSDDEPKNQDWQNPIPYKPKIAGCTWVNPALGTRSVSFFGNGNYYIPCQTFSLDWSMGKINVTPQRYDGLISWQKSQSRCSHIILGFLGFRM